MQAAFELGSGPVSAHLPILSDIHASLLPFYFILYANQQRENCQRI